jgi:hypothetical protein
MNEVAGINIEDYLEEKKAGRITIAKVGGGCVIVAKSFNPKTGIEQDSNVYGISLANLQKQKATLVKSADDIQALITDFEALK